MSYLTRLSQQTGLTTAPGQSLPLTPGAEPAPGTPSEVEAFTSPPDRGQSMVPPAPPVSSSPGPPEPNPEPLPFLEVSPTPQDSAPAGLPPIATPVEPTAESSISLSVRELAASDGAVLDRPSSEYLEPDRQVNAPPAVPQPSDLFEPAIAELPQSVMGVPEVTDGRSPPPAPGPTVETQAEPEPQLTYLQTLQVVRAWVSASPESQPMQETAAAAQEGAIDVLPTAGQSPGTARSPAEAVSAMALATPSEPMFPTAAPPPAISIGSIAVVVEGPSAPPAPAPARSPRSPHPAPRLSRHYLRLR